MTDHTPPVLVAMCGIPFAGKSTLARRLAVHCGWPIVAVDAIVEELSIDLGEHAGDQGAWAMAMAEGNHRLRALLAAGESVVYDTANHTRRNRDRCRRIAIQAEATFRLVWVDVPVDVARDRLLVNRRIADREDVPDPAFRYIVDSFEPPLDEPDVVCWRPGMEIEDVIRER